MARAAIARPVVAGVVLVALFAFFFVYPSHDPKPNGLPVAVVGEAGADVGARLEQADGGAAFEVARVPDEGRARERIRDRDAYAAIVPGSPPRVLVATAAGPVVAMTLQGLAADMLPGAQIVEVAPLDPDDLRGTALNTTTLALTVPAILGAVALFVAAPALSGPARLGALAVFALLGALAAMLIIAVGLGALPGPFLGLVGVAVIGIFAMATSASVLMRLIGMPGIAVSFLLFLMLANPATGAASAPELLPDPWSWGGQLLPPGAMATGIRNVAYFDAAELSAWLAVLVAWALVAAAALLALARPARRTEG